MTESITAKQLARQLGVTPRQFRRFLRTRSSSDEAVGRGHQYEFPEEEVDRIKAEYKYWRIRVNQKKHERKTK